MSAVYRIDVEHRPGESYPYSASIVRLSDGEAITFRHGDTAGIALARARETIIELSNQEDTVSVYVDENGATVDRHSVRA